MLLMVDEDKASRACGVLGPCSVTTLFTWNRWWLYRTSQESRIANVLFKTC